MKTARAYCGMHETGRCGVTRCEINGRAVLLKRLNSVVYDWKCLHVTKGCYKNWGFDDFDMEKTSLMALKQFWEDR